MTCSLLVRRSVRIVENWYILSCFSNSFLHPLFLSLPISFAHSFLLFLPSLSSFSLSLLIPPLFYLPWEVQIFIPREKAPCRVNIHEPQDDCLISPSYWKLSRSTVLRCPLHELYHGAQWPGSRQALFESCFLALTSPLSLLLPTVPSLEFNTVCFILHLRLRCLNGSFHSFKMQQMFNIFPSQFFFRDGAGGWAVAGGGAVTTSFERWLLKCRVLSGIHSAMKSRWRLLSRMH